jgi:hypothetical protein
MRYQTLLILISSFAVGCAGGPREQTQKVNSSIELSRISWLEGRWVGFDESGKPFHEGYHLLNDSTIRTYSFADSTDGTPTDSGAIELRNGIASTGSDASRWSVDSIADGYVHFSPIKGARNNFSWSKVDANNWIATLDFPANGDKPARTVVYKMHRVMQ